MNETTDKILRVLEPPPGGLARLVSRRNSRVRASAPWWALAAGAATAVVWMTVLSGHVQIRMELAGARLIGERSQGVDYRPSSSPTLSIQRETLFQQ